MVISGHTSGKWRPFLSGIVQGDELKRLESQFLKDIPEKTWYVFMTVASTRKLYGLEGIQVTHGCYG